MFGRSIAATNSSLIVFGGFDQAELSSAVYSLNLGTSFWTEVDCMNDGPSPRAYSQATIHANHLYIFGGSDAGNSSLGDLYALDLELRVWISFADLSPQGRQYGTIKYFGASEALVVAGGSPAEASPIDMYFLRHKPTVSDDMIQTHPNYRKVFAFLEREGFQDLKRNFLREEVDDEAFSAMPAHASDELLIDLGVSTLGKRVKLLSAVKAK
eukprot:c15013_g1_i2.p1 GENE.c15013_g1_i2~~c15013_g1_i2.p1  ORF type:complete len:212 (+),score=37.54 c15013_g1_i2:655-1290(+)